MKKQIEANEYTLSYQDSEKVRDAVYQAVLDWFVKHESFSGESIMQMDDPIIDAPVLLSNIADNIMDFEVDWKDE